MNIKILFHPTVKEIFWMKPYFYDFYDPPQKVIIETHGLQHYKEVKNFTLSLKETKENDKKKKKML